MENQNQKLVLKRELRELLGRASISGIVPDTTIDDCMNALIELKTEMAPSLSLADDCPRPKKRPRGVRTLSFDNQNLFEGVTDWAGKPISPLVMEFFENLLDEFSGTLPIKLMSLAQIQGLTREYSDIRSVFLNNELILKFLKPFSNGTGTVEVQQQLITTFLNLLMEQRIQYFLSGNKSFFCIITSLLRSVDPVVKLKSSLVLSYFTSEIFNRQIMISSGCFKALLQFLGEAGSDSFILDCMVPTRVACSLSRHVVNDNTNEDLILTAVKVFLGFIQKRECVMDMLTAVEMMSRSPSVCAILVTEGTVNLVINLLKERRGTHIDEYGVSVLEYCCQADPNMLAILSNEPEIIQIARRIPDCEFHKTARVRAEALISLLTDRA